MIPVGHNAFKGFPEFVQKLFINCFDGGVTKPSLRPTALDWINKLTAKPSIKFFKTDKEIIFDTQKFTLSWETENGRTAEVEGFGTVELNGSLQLAVIGQSFFKLKISNEFGDTLQDLSITRFPTPVIESLKVPTPTFESRLNLNPITIQSPNINVSINFETNRLSQASASFTKLNDDIQNATPMFKKETTKWNSISKLFEELKIRINNI